MHMQYYILGVQLKVYVASFQARKAKARLPWPKFSSRKNPPRKNRMLRNFTNSIPHIYIYLKSIKLQHQHQLKCNRITLATNQHKSTYISVKATSTNCHVRPTRETIYPYRSRPCITLWSRIGHLSQSLLSNDFEHVSLSGALLIDIVSTCQGVCGSELVFAQQRNPEENVFRLVRIKLAIESRGNEDGNRWLLMGPRRCSGSSLVGRRPL
jgi:hypothetical protein